MYVITARNVNDALYQGINHLETVGVLRNSRNGPVKIAPTPVTTVYEKPLERVLLWPERDANPYFHLYEALWMLAGCNDVKSVARYAKQISQYSDDGTILHGAYGHRWRFHFGKDQLKLIAEALQKNPDDRRQVLQMWDANVDLGRSGKDLPCNTIATFQVNTEGALDLTVFCRSNDIIWGAYGANAVHFSFLLEYMALWIGVPVGKLYQVSVNWHAYLETFEPLVESFRDPKPPLHSYEQNVQSLLLGGTKEEVDRCISEILTSADFQVYTDRWTHEWARTVSQILRAHQLWRDLPAPERYEQALEILTKLNQKVDFVVAATDWMVRRAVKWMQKMERV